MPFKYFWRECICFKIDAISLICTFSGVSKKHSSQIWAVLTIADTEVKSSVCFLVIRVVFNVLRLYFHVISSG